jgi:putative ABC transport system ATP-binding protein
VKRAEHPHGLEPQGQVAVRIRGVVKHFGIGEHQVTALRGIDWDIFAGELSMLVGPSGCGKTTLLSVVAGIMDCDEGSVAIFGRDVTAMDDLEKTSFRAESIGFVFQQYNLLPALTAAENAAIPLIIAGTAWQTGRRACPRSSPAASSSGSRSPAP